MNYMEHENLGMDFFNGGEIELEAVMKLYGQSLLRYCHNIICDYHEAQDAVQITFIKAYEKRSTFNADMNFSSWLYKIAYNTCVDILRGKKLKFPRIPLQTNNNFIPEHIRKALLMLNAADRALMYGRIMEEKSFEELSKIHGKSSAALRKRYERAKKKLSGILIKDYPEYKTETKWRNENETKPCDL